jgi:hypothetical protein
VNRVNAQDPEELTDDELHEILAPLLDVAGPTPEQTQQAKDRINAVMKEKGASVPAS